MARMVDKRIRYIVKIDLNWIHNRSSKFRELTVIDKEFCGYLIEINSEFAIFRMHESNAWVKIPQAAILWIAPSKELYENGYDKPEKIYY